MKVYKSKSQVSINIKIGDGHAHIHFSSVTAGGSVFYTDDAEVQKGIESHPKFGKLFKFDREILPEPEPTEAKVSEESREETIQKIKVSDLNAAKDYLCERYGASRTKLRSEKAIMTAASEKGIVFDFE